MIDLMFSIYFSFFHKRGERGAEAAVLLLTLPIAFMVYISVLFILSLVFEIAGISAILFSIGAILVAIVVQYFFRSRYVIGRRFEKIVIKNPIIYYFLGITFYLFSLIMFPILSYILLAG